MKAYLPIEIKNGSKVIDNDKVYTFAAALSFEDKTKQVYLSISLNLSDLLFRKVIELL